ncbi:MAG: universal stress protein [Flavobacteriaceae bacterium]|nr:universal stress protein [Flavobacteriaceae bacterium]
MKNILVPIGSNENAVNTLQYAIDFAEQVNAKIYLIHVFSSSKISGSFVKMDDLFERESKKILKDHLSNVDKKNVEILSKSLKGYNIIDSIEQLANVFKIDLLITSTKNDTSDKSIFLGKVTGSFVKDTKIPVLIIPSMAKFKPISKVLMAVKSGIIKSKSALNALVSIQKEFNTTVNLLQVKTPNLKEKDLEIDKELNEIKSDLILTENATVFQAVLEFLHEENPDLICVIRRKRGFFKKLWEEDKIKKIDFESKIPLLVLKGKV